MKRRDFLQLTALAMLAPFPSWAESSLSEFAYGDVKLNDNLQRDQTLGVLMELSDDAMLKPYRKRAGQDAPGAELGGWYAEDPAWGHGHSAGFAPGHAFGQWVSALSRGYAATGNSAYRDKVHRLLDGYSATVTPAFYQNFRFPAYTYDKLVCGLVDARLTGYDSWPLLDRTTDAALPSLPPRALERGEMPAGYHDPSFTWDESYTLPENLYRASEQGAGSRYRRLAERFLLDRTYFDPLSEGKNVLGQRHAYSYVNALCSAVEAYRLGGSAKHLRAARNGFSMLLSQSFATGGWGPDELLGASLRESLDKSHNSFETPCGTYAHFKLARALMRLTGESRYGDSMERLFYNAITGVKPLQADGHAFYYSDYNLDGHKRYYGNPFPCCAGSLPQIVCDYGISSYLHDRNSLYVNLYLPSTVRGLTQTGNYPYDDTIDFAYQGHPCDLRLRIPEWAVGATVNGRPVAPGRFASVPVCDGDRLKLRLPLALRLEPLGDVVALLRGPLVLMAVGSGTATRSQLLNATRVDECTWQAGTLRLKPFSAIVDEPYSAYVRPHE
jgi:hypothetical protein